jgi:hypothetical protein
VVSISAMRIGPRSERNPTLAVVGVVVIALQARSCR